MLRRSPTRASQPVSPLRIRLMSTIAVAFVGATAGLLYVRMTMPDLPESSRLPALYGGFGSVFAVLGVRLAGLFRAILSDYFTRE